MNIPLLLSHVIEFQGQVKPNEALHYQLQNYLQKRKYLGSKDRRFIADIVYDIERYRLQYESQTADLSSEILRRTGLTVLSCKRRFQELSAALQFSKTDEISQLWPVLEFNQIADQPLPVRYSMPEWIFSRMQTAYGAEKAEAIAEKMLEEASVHLRLNPSRVQEFRCEDYPLLAAGNISPLAWRLKGRMNVQQSEIYRNGVVEIQDEGSQLIGFAVNPKAGETIVDLCAGAGGKTIHMASLMSGSGEVIASDISAARMSDLPLRLRRNRLENVKITDYDDVLETMAAKADAVLVDAPCSGSGVFRRYPDAKWRLTEDQLPAVIKAQQDALSDAQHVVKAGGRLIYATCSLFAEENEAQARWFLKQFPDFQSVSVSATLKESDIILQESGEIGRTIFPFEFDTDGFYMAVFQKK